MGCRALLIDAMGTLVSLQPPVPHLRREFAERFGVELSVEQAARAIAAEISFYRAHMDQGRDERSVASLHARCAAALRGALDDDRVLPGAVSDQALTEALLSSLRFSVFDDALPALQIARERGLAVVVVSNWDVSLGRQLAGLGLAPLLHGVVTSAEVGVAKPGAAIFEAALSRAGARAVDALHVGDGLEEDVRGAVEAGVRAVWLRRDGDLSAPEGVTTIASLSELAGLL
jgi:putative hydrolase of the HAD superfamily